MSIKLLLLDLDDTLLGKDLEISPANRAALAAAAAAGVGVTLASGRMFRSMRPYAEDLDLALPLITYNGALARPLAGPDLWHQPLAGVTARALLAKLARYDVTVNLYLDDRLYVKGLDQRALRYAANARVAAEPVGDLLSSWAQANPPRCWLWAPRSAGGAPCGALGGEFAGQAEITISKPALP